MITSFYCFRDGFLFGFAEILIFVMYLSSFSDEGVMLRKLKYIIYIHSSYIIACVSFILLLKEQSNKNFDLIVRSGKLLFMTKIIVKREGKKSVIISHFEENLCILQLISLSTMLEIQ